MIRPTKRGWEGGGKNVFGLGWRRFEIVPYRGPHGYPVFVVATIPSGMYERHLEVGLVCFPLSFETSIQELRLPPTT